MSQETGDVATVVKLMRVAMLLPVIVFAVMLSRRQASETAGPRPPLLPGSRSVSRAGGGQQHRLVAEVGRQDRQRPLALAASSPRSARIGMKTQLKELATVGIKPIVLMIGETVFLAALTLALMHWLV